MDNPKQPTGPAKYKAMKADTAAKPNFTPTSDPDTHMGKYGVPIKRSEFEASQKDKDGLKFDNFDHYADWVGGWARPTKPAPAEKPDTKQTKPTLDLSDKAKGYSNTYYTPNH